MTGLLMNKWKIFSEKLLSRMECLTTKSLPGYSNMEERKKMKLENSLFIIKYEEES